MAKEKSKYASFFERRQYERAAEKEKQNAADGLLPQDVQEYMDEYARVAASGMNEVDYYNDQRSKLQARIEEELKTDMRKRGINPRSPMGQQYANMYMKYALDASPEYQLANSMYNQAYTAQREKDLIAQTKAEQQKVADFSAAMQNIDPVTGMSYDDLNAQGAQSRADVAGWFNPKVNRVYDGNVDAVSGAQQTHAPNVWEPGYFDKP